jgi:hypothetical protein
VTLTGLERRVADEIERREDELVSLLSDLIAFDTTARDELNAPARDEAALQAYLAERLRVERGRRRTSGSPRRRTSRGRASRRRGFASTGGRSSRRASRERAAAGASC